MGVWPMAMNAPVASMVSVLPSCVFSRTAPLSPLSSESHSLICRKVRISIFGWLAARSYMMVDALNTSRRWMSVTLLAKRVKKVASSHAESPPPMTNTCSSRKKAPSQVAQVEMPRPFCSASPGASNHKDSAPVQTIMECVRKVSPSTITLYGRSLKSTSSTFLSSTSSPKRSACSRSCIIISGPAMPSGYPGKFSISLVSINCPPDM